MSMQLCSVLTLFVVCLKMLTRPDDHKARISSDISRVRCAHDIAFALAVYQYVLTCLYK